MATFGTPNWGSHTTLLFQKQKIAAHTHSRGHMENAVSTMDVLDIGKDPGTWSFRKVFISQIFEKVQTSEIAGFAFNHSLFGRPLPKIEVVGIVRSLDRKTNKVLISCDDGTGIIECIKHCDATDSPFIWLSVGLLVSVRGSLALNESNSRDYGFLIQVNSVDALLDPNLELLHWATCMHNQRDS